MKDEKDNELERDIVEFVGEDGGMMELEVVDYFLYDGDEYVILADLGSNPEAFNNGDKVDVFIMLVNVIDEENEEFVMIPPEKEDDVLDYAAKLLGEEHDHENCDHEHHHHHHEDELI